MIRIATAPVSWGILEIEGWARQKSYAEVLDEMVQAGYAGTELGPHGFLPTDPKELNSELQKRHLTMLGAFVPLPLADSARHQEGERAALEVARLLAAVGAPFLILADEMNQARMAIAGTADHDEGFTDIQWHDAARFLQSIAKSALEIGVRSVFHHHAGTFVETPAEVERLLALMDPAFLGICFDTGHYFYGGGDPVEFARHHAARIWHLHLKDVRSAVLNDVRRDRVPYLEAIRRGVFCELGEGNVDLRGVMRELESRGFDGWAVFEQDVDPTLPGVNPMTSAARSREYLRRVVGV